MLQFEQILVGSDSNSGRVVVSERINRLLLLFLLIKLGPVYYVYLPTIVY